MKKTITIIVEQEQHDELRKRSYETRKSISEIIREAIEELLKKGK